MNIESKIEELTKLEKEMEILNKVMIDGAIDNKKYFESKYQIAWFLKEPYSEEDDSFYYRSYFESKDLYGDWFKTVARPTWHPIIYVSYSILNGFKTWEEMDYIRNDHSMCDVIKSIAIINANKNYSVTGTWTSDENLFEGFLRHQELIGRQTKLLNPNVNIFGNTFHLYKDSFNIDDKHIVSKLSIDNLLNVYLKDNKIYLDAFHPASRKRNYINSIVNAVKNLSLELA